MVKGDNRRFAITAGGLILSAPASYVVQRALGSWGVLDDVSDSLGRWLKVHVPPATAGWTIALLFVLAIYGLLLWKVWRPRHIHHVDPAPEKIGFGDSAKAQIVRAPIQAGSADDPHRPLNRWLQESWEAAQADRRTKRKADRLREAEPRRDVALPEALAFATFGEWGKTFYDAVTAGLVPSNEPLMRFRQMAHDGTLSVWGKRSENSVFQVIPKEHWLDHNVEWVDLLLGSARTENVMHTAPDPFLELMVSRAQFEKEWPHAE